MARAGFCPYVGLQPYTEDDRQFFFGREREQRIISSNLYASPLTVVYGPSGVGKSSILRAGVVPRLRAAKRTVVVYFNRWQDPSFLGLLKTECLKAADGPGQLAHVDPHQPLNKFLADLGKDSNSTLLILLDQFEEYFLYHPEAESVSDFDGEFASAVNQNETPVGFMIALRDDWLSRLDRFQRRIPNLLGNTYRLDHLTAAAAEDAIRKPLDVYNATSGNGPVLLEDQLVQEVLAQVRAGELNLSEMQGSGQAKGAANQDRIETAFLQLVMTRLWNAELNVGSGCLRVGTLRQLGGAKQIVQSHLDSVLNTLPRSQQDMCASMFRYLVTPRGSKIAHETADLVAFAEQPVEQVTPLLERLADPSTHLLRRLSQPERYEIFHDVLGPAVLDWRTRFTKEQEKIELARQAKAEAQRRSAKRMRWLSYGLAAFGIIVAALAVYAAMETTKRAAAEKEKATAEATSTRLNQEKSKATADAELAKQAAERKEAEAKRQEAEKDAAIAENQSRIAVSHRLADMSLLARGDGRDSELTLLLALTAARITFERDRTVLPDVEETLRRSIRIEPIELARSGHAKAVTSMAFSPKGDLLVTSGGDNTVRIWNTSIGAQQELVYDKIQCTALPGVVFSPNGASIACATSSELRVWDAGSHRELLRLPAVPAARTAPGNYSIQQIALAADGQTVIAGCSDGRIRRWDLSGKNLDSFAGRLPVAIESGRRIAYLTAQGITLRDLTTGQEQTIAVSGASALVASADGDHVAARSTIPGPPRRIGLFTIWDTTSLNVSGQFTDTSAAYLAISPDGSRAATYDGKTQVKLWNVAAQSTPTDIMSLPGGFVSRSASLFFSPDGKTLVLRPVTPPGDVQSWDATSGQATKGAGWTATAFSQDGRVALANQSSLRIDRPNGRGPSQTIYDRESSFNMAAFSPNGELVAVATLDDHVHLWDRATGVYVAELGQHSANIEDIQFSSDGRFLVTASDDGSAKVWDVAGHSERFPLEPEPGTPRGKVLGAVFSRDAKFLATASEHLAVIWELSSGKRVASLVPHNPGTRVEDLAFSPDRRRLVVIANKTEFWDIASPQPRFLGEQPKPARLSYSVTFASDGRHLVAPGNEGVKRSDASAKQWNLLPASLTAPPKGLNWLGIAISPDQRTVAGSGTSGTIIVWDLDTGKVQTTLYGGKTFLKSLAYSPDGKALYTLAEDWKVYEYPAPLQLVLQRAQAEIEQGNGPKELNEESCLELLHERCPQEVLALKKVNPRQEKAISQR
jgi:WD40 repeat protein